MIPILFRLRKEIRFEDRDGFSLVISEAPLNVIRASKRAVRLLRLCDGERTLSQIALESGPADEEQVLRICDYFNKKAVLETAFLENRGYFPSVTVIIPSIDRGLYLVECLSSVFAQDYPAERIEVIVIDDGSRDETQQLAAGFPCRLLTNSNKRGQSYCRNLGAAQARSEILAFLDSDCVAAPCWLKDLVPGFLWEKAGAVGGYVDGYSDRSALDRYEQKFSLLNLGKYIQRSADDGSMFYIPTCNLLVRRRAFFEAGGIRETLHLGEDVDFCWRMRAAGWQALYVPAGIVRHKHRNTLRPMLRRRADYGSSEALLHRLHPRKRKTLQIRVLAALAFLGLGASIVFLTPLPLIATAACWAAEAAAKAFRLRRKRVSVPCGKMLLAAQRTHLSYFYLVAFHLVRYYLVFLLLVGFIYHSLLLFAAALLLFTSFTDYSAKRPRLAFPLFFFYYALDQVAYQLGAFAGCLRAKSFRSYYPLFFRARRSFVR